jgi:hypothetical protein
MPEEARHRETFTRSFTPKETVRSFNGKPSDPTPLPADTPFSVTPKQTPATPLTLAPEPSSSNAGTQTSASTAASSGGDHE